MRRPGIGAATGPSAASPPAKANPQDYYRFPDAFLWGCATASYQVEGPPRKTHASLPFGIPARTSPDTSPWTHTGDVAVDQYHRYLCRTCSS